MELITAVILFSGIVVSWIFLPSAPPVAQAGHGVPSVASSKA